MWSATNPSAVPHGEERLTKQPLNPGEKLTVQLNMDKVLLSFSATVRLKKLSSQAKSASTQILLMMLQHLTTETDR